MGFIQFGWLNAEPDADHFNDRDVIIIHRDAALIFRIPEDGGIAHVGRIHIFVIVGNRVVAKFFRHCIKLAADTVKLGGANFRENVVPGKILSIQRLQQAEFHHPFDIDAVHHKNIPVTRLRLFEQGQGDTGAVILLHVNPDTVFLFERF